MRFRLTAANGTVLDEGEGTAEMTAGALVVSPSFGQPLRIVPSDIAEIAEPEPYVVLIRLHEGASVTLTGLGRMRTQILAELDDVRGKELPATMLIGGVGTPEAFGGSVDGVEADVLLYDDALVTLPKHGDGEKVPYPFISGLTTDPSGYRLTISVAGRRPLDVHRLARRTSEFHDLLAKRWTATAGRTAAFLGSLLPGLGPIALRSTAALLRDGLAAARSDLDAIDPTIFPALVGAASLGDRVACLDEMGRRGPVWIGFKQMVSVQRGAEGKSSWTDPAATPPNADHDGGASFFGGGFGGMMGASIMGGGPPTGMGFDGPFGAMGSMLAMSMLGRRGPGGAGLGGGIGGGQDPMHARADVEHQRLKSAYTDFEALSATGEEPTVLAFALCHARGHVIYEVLNETDHATYLYRARDASDVSVINRALDLTGYRVEGIYQDATSAGSKYRKAAERLSALRVLRDAFVGRVIHTEAWAASLSSQIG